MTLIDELLGEVARLKGITPHMPPLPNAGEGLPRYGLRWNGPEQPLATPMEDGYWTPWHLADAALSTESIDVERLRELIISQAARAVAMRRIGMNGKEEDEIANCLRQLLRIAEGKP